MRNIPTSRDAKSSLRGAAFQTVWTLNSRGVACRMRKEIMTLRRLRQDPLDLVSGHALRGWMRTRRGTVMVT